MQLMTIFWREFSSEFFSSTTSEKRMRMSREWNFIFGLLLFVSFISIGLDKYSCVCKHNRLCDGILLIFRRELIGYWFVFPFGISVALDRRIGLVWFRSHARSRLWLTGSEVLTVSMTILSVYSSLLASRLWGLGVSGWAEGPLGVLIVSWMFCFSV